jgi:geranylgeranyl pyrophosphate synthase
MDNLRLYFAEKLTDFIGTFYPPTNDLNRAIAYALGGPGKRIRPIYSLLSCQSLGGDLSQALPAALAIEMVHTYSLIHDDLPCMDNDSLRRGRPTTHVVFGDALALLAGDALLTDAFSILADEQNANFSLVASLRQVAALTKAAGSRGMILGQHLDLHWTDREGANKEILDSIHLNKTGRLIGAACAMGALAAGADVNSARDFTEFGSKIGLAFQIFDDLLDDEEQTGKSRGKDVEANKLTYLRLMGRSEAREAATNLTSSANAFLPSDCRRDELIKFSNALLFRQK